jgi:flagellar basal-body rod modification protein FlgD
MDSPSVINSASDIQMNYMKLLITQLQNQNPLEPMDNNQMASQLAQFSQLQQLETMNSSFADILSTTEHNYANSLIGREISFASENDVGTQEITSGIVEEVVNNIDGKTVLITGNNTIAMEDVISVRN